MGMTFRLTCGGCGYEAEVSGGRDVGMEVEVETVSCGECRTLQDAVVMRLGSKGVSPNASGLTFSPASS